MLVGLARTRDTATVIEGERVDLGGAVEEGLEVGGGEERVLLLVVTGDEQGVVVEDVELVEQAGVRGRHERDEELLLIRRDEGVLRGLAVRGRRCGLRLALQIGDDADEERDAPRPR